MADVATKNNKSISVVSSNNAVNSLSKAKLNDVVCGVQSNNGLIDLDHNCLSNNPANNKLITLCSPVPSNDGDDTNNDEEEDEDEDEDDLILANNARNELDSQDDKSLQELIESELALRISAASNGDGTGAGREDDTSEDEASEIMNTQPEITRKIILEPRPEPALDLNTEFIVNEIDHYTLIGEPYEFANGHLSPAESKAAEPQLQNGELLNGEDEEETIEAQTETTETEVTTTTTSGPSLPSAFEAAELERDELPKSQPEQQPLEDEEDPAASANTLSDSCVVDEATDEDTSKELSHKSVISADKHLQEELELVQNVQAAEQQLETSIEEQEQQEQQEPAKSEENTREDAQDDLENDDGEEDSSARLNDLNAEDRLQENSETDAALSCSTFIEHEIRDAGVRATSGLQVEEEDEGAEVSEEIFDQDEPISLKEASGVDEKACSFYSTEPDTCADNDEGIAKANGLDVAHYQLKSDDNKENAWLTVEEAVKEANADVTEAKADESLQEKTNECSENFYSQESHFENYLEKSRFEDDGKELAPLATPDEISDISNACDDSESREEVTSSVVSTTTKKKKKIEGSSAASDASPNHTKTKKTKKSKKSELEKENISVKSSFSKFDALTKKSSSVLHVRSVDAGKVQQQLNAVANGDANPNCRSCGKVVFQMEQTKAEGQVWHKNCFRCVQCSKQLNVDNYESHEATLYCKPHFKELFLPKPVEEADQPTSDKPDLGLEELSSLNVKSRFQVFEKATEQTNEIERSPSQVAVKRSPSILSKLAKFQAKGMDIGVADEALNGIPYEESSESEEEIEEEETEEVETETSIVKAKRGNRERPMSFAKMGDIKSRWETTSQQGRRESQREARKEEIAGIRSRLFMGKQGKMKELYQQAVADSERVTKINAAEEIQHATNARSIKERFERGEPIAASSDDEQEPKNKPEKPDEEILAAGISRKSRSLFLELDATAAKTGRPVTPNSATPKAPTDASRRARDAFMGRQVSEDVVRSSDTTEEVQVDVSDISNKFKFFETYREPEKTRKQFRITPPRDGQVKMDSPDREIYRDPDVVRAEDRAEEVVRTDTARKMLSIFRQMEENATKEDLPDGPKPLKRFTPPPEDKFAKRSLSEESEDENEAEESEDEEQNPNYVRASDKVEDEFLKQAQQAARAKTLRAKFEHWEETSDGKSNHHVAEMEYAQTDGTQPSIESASSLRARFESLGSQPVEAPRTPKVKVNRFVEIQTNCMDVCESCEKKVYPLEKVETNNKIFHKQCFRCLQCNCILRMDTFTLNNGKLYCIPHFKQLFITRGNYDEGFGVDPHKNKWSLANNSAPNATTTTATATTTPQAASPAPIAVANGDV